MLGTTLTCVSDLPRDQKLMTTNRNDNVIEEYQVLQK